jgi:multisubunit Na+/H+ antiporter MnhC subunit
MIVIVDVVLGLLLAVSALLLVICLISYRRSGVRPIVFSCYIFVISMAYDVGLLAVGHSTDWLKSADDALMVTVGAAILALGVLLSRVGRR